jgi:O-antigen/teichoic acid export membrane protein
VNSAKSNVPVNSDISNTNLKPSDTQASPIAQRRLADLALLYASKSGAVIVGVLILPLFDRILGPDLFGIVALIFALQAFLLLLDFGMSTVVGRDLASSDTATIQEYATWHAAEWIISVVYAGIAFLVLLGISFWPSPLNCADAFGCLILFWALTLQNIGQNALLARHKFTETALIQVSGVLARHGLTAIALSWIAPTLFCFIVTQAAVALIQLWLTRWRCNHILKPNIKINMRDILRERAVDLIRTGKPLMLFGLSGAAVMQLDKIIISGLMSPRDLASYFLASTFCITPISVLASPVAQFFQPRIIRAITVADSILVRHTVTQFNYYIAACALIPSAVIWLLREPLITIWLHNSPNAQLVAQYSAVLLPGIAIGAFGYVPYTMLIACRDYSFQARFSSAMTICTLGFVLVAAFYGSVIAICIIYSAYHSVSAIGSWLRCLSLQAGGIGIAALGMKQALIISGIFIIAAVNFGKIN